MHFRKFQRERKNWVGYANFPVVGTQLVQASILWSVYKLAFTKILLEFTRTCECKYPMKHFYLYSQVNFTKILYKSKSLEIQVNLFKLALKPICRLSCKRIRENSTESSVETLATLIKYPSYVSCNILTIFLYEILVFTSKNKGRISQHY